MTYAWILIFVAGVSGSPPTAAFSQRFDNSPACAHAKEDLEAKVKAGVLVLDCYISATSM